MPQNQTAFNLPDIFNPFMVWTDMAMKATDAIVSSGQAIGDRVDQVARASANSNAKEVEPLRLMGGGTALAVTQPSLDMFMRIQTNNIELMSRMWQQLFNSLGAFGALMPHRGLTETLTQAAAPFVEAAQAVVDVQPREMPARSAASAKRQPRAKTSSRATGGRSKAK